VSKILPVSTSIRCPQNTSIKVQGSISHTPEGTNTERERLKGVGARITKIKVHVASGAAIGLWTTPVVSGGEFIRNITISKFKLLNTWSKPLTWIKTFFLKFLEH